MNDGYVKLWRKSMDSIVYQDDVMWRVWTTCLMLANHKEQKVLMDGKEVTVKPGQFITGRYEFHKAMYPKKRKPPKSALTIWRTLVKLRSLANLNMQTNNRYTMITICNWDAYQSAENKSEQVNEQLMNKSCTSPEHKQECKECKEDKYILDAREDREAGTYETSFEAAEKKQPVRFSLDDEKRVLDYLNDITGKKHNYCQPIRARLMDGYSVDQLLHVIDIKAKHDPHFIEHPHFLNPKTLFADKGSFDAYVNQAPEDFLKSKPSQFSTTDPKYKDDETF